MALLPFNIAKQKKIKVVIIGGGYAGMAALITLARYASDTSITIIDPRDQHVKTTHLHETFRYPLEDILVPFHDIENRFGCRHIKASIDFTCQDLHRFQEDRRLIVDGEVFDFDYLVVTVGCRDRVVEESHEKLLLKDFEATPGSELITKILNSSNQSNPSISVVGGGATGIQFLFELRFFLNRINSETTLNLVHSKGRVLELFPASFNDYVQSRMQDLEINFYPNCYFYQQQSGQIQLTNRLTEKRFALPSIASLVFLGKEMQNNLSANAFGQVIVNHQVLPNVFTAGDYSNYESIGSNARTAQAAVRKGKLTARNILRHAGFPGLLEPYVHQDLGSVVNLGAHDAVGWLGTRSNLVTGISALAIKEIVEAQYDLMLSGVDTYLV